MPTTGPSSFARRWMRRRDRRSGMGTLLGPLGLAVARHRGTAVRPELEAMLEKMLPGATVALRESAAEGALHVSEARETVRLRVPLSNPPPVVLEATRLGGRFDDWERQLLQGATAVASLVIELDRRGTALSGKPLMRARSSGRSALVGASARMRYLRERIDRVAATDFTVLIEGESGTGKELVARQIHDLSRRRNGPFVPVNCAALVETLVEAELFGIEDRTATGVRGRRGKFEAADGGTLFLDEISDLSPAAQAKLLRALQDLAVERVGSSSSQRIDMRVVAATNRPLAGLVEKERFRLDLYYRLNGVEIAVPPLRERREDIVELIEHFLQRHHAMRRLSLSQPAADALIAYEWPGNVRELERVIERAVALADGDTITPDDLPSVVRGEYVEVMAPSIASDETLRAWGSRYARLVLARCNNNKRKACGVLGITYHTLQAYLRYGREQTAPEDQASGEL